MHLSKAYLHTSSESSITEVKGFTLTGKTLLNKTSKVSKLIDESTSVTEIVMFKCKKQLNIIKAEEKNVTDKHGAAKIRA